MSRSYLGLATLILRSIQNRTVLVGVPAAVAVVCDLEDFVSPPLAAIRGSIVATVDAGPPPASVKPESTSGERRAGEVVLGSD